MEDLYEILENKSKRHEVVISGNEGYGKIHGVINVAMRLQDNNGYKCIMVDLKKAFKDFSTAKATDILKDIFPAENLIDMLDPMGCIEKGFKTYQEVTGRRLVFIIDNAHLILEMTDEKEKNGLIEFAHHTLFDVVLCR